MERLQKVIAHAGIASRRKAEEYITSGRVKVNGQVVTELGTKIGKNDSIEVDNLPIYQEERVYYLFYKPKSVISAVSDDKGRAVVTDFFSHEGQRIYPVGRLDYDTSGLLLVTNDGAFSQYLTHPSHEIKKVYVAKVKGLIDKNALQALKKGITIENYRTAPAEVSIISTDLKTKTSIVELSIHEGRNHQVKKMLQAVGFPVQKLKRERYGQLTLNGLRPGEYRTLTKKEIKALYSGSSKG